MMRSWAGGTDRHAIDVGSESLNTLDIGSWHTIWMIMKFIERTYCATETNGMMRPVGGQYQCIGK